MDDLISRKAAMAAIDGIELQRNSFEQVLTRVMCRAAVEEVEPVTEAVFVVRCAECAHFVPVNVQKRYYRCGAWDMDFCGSTFEPTEFYCAEGIKRYEA